MYVDSIYTVYKYTNNLYSYSYEPVLLISNYIQKEKKKTIGGNLFPIALAN